MCFCVLHKVTQSRNPKKLGNAILKYSLGSICTIRITHIENEAIFGSCKLQKVNLAPILKGGSHKHNRVNFSHPRVNHRIVKLGVEIEQLRWIKFMEMLRSLRLHVEMDL
jgi:hypothetical protein